MTSRLKLTACATFVGAALLSVSTLASADDIGVGVGISYVFGSGVAVGVKAFSNDEDNEAVGSVGLDYLVQTGAFRPNVGVAYQGEGYFSGADVGFNLGTQTVDFGVGAGWSNSDDDKKHESAPAAPLFPPV